MSGTVMKYVTTRIYNCDYLLDALLDLMQPSPYTEDLKVRLAYRLCGKKNVEIQIKIIFTRAKNIYIMFQAYMDQRISE